MQVVMKSGQKIEAKDVIPFPNEQSLLVTDTYAVWVDSNEIEDVYVGA
ncbi:hypothetical protein HPMBJEAJ_00188 [Aeromonas phage avDM6]|nr:hypothetical protein HPMBJEAJ_00188 [Aeromonas phage avDM6]